MKQKTDCLKKSIILINLWQDWKKIKEDKTQITSIRNEIGDISTNPADIKKTTRGTSLVAQWLRICLPMQGTRV